MLIRKRKSIYKFPKLVIKTKKRFKVGKRVDGVLKGSRLVISRKGGSYSLSLSHPGGISSKVISEFYRSFLSVKILSEKQRFLNDKVSIEKSMLLLSKEQMFELIIALSKEKIICFYVKDMTTNNCRDYYNNINHLKEYMDVD